MFKVDLKGRIGNLTLGKEDALLPLFDAVINSIQAIQEKKALMPDHQGEIFIYITRDIPTAEQKQLELNEDKQAEPEKPEKETKTFPILSFKIVDNGIGFNGRNFDSFLTTDSTYKKHLGCKGIGRLLWLKAFSSVNIESVYQDNGKLKLKNFDFNLLIPKLVKINRDEEVENISNITTTVKLDNIKAAYQQSLPKLTKVVALKIIEHCLPIFISNNIPKICLIDEYYGDNLSLIDLFDNEFKRNIKQKDFNIKGNDFILTHFEGQGREYNQHKVYYCANDRIVESDRLTKYPELDNKLSSNENSFWYIAFVQSNILNDTVNESRTGFNLPKRKNFEKDLMNKLIESTLFIDDVKEESLKYAYKYIEPFFEEIWKDKESRLKETINKDLPNLAYLLRNEDTKKEIIQNIDMNKDRKSRESKLYEIHTKKVVERNIRGKNLLESDVKDYDQYDNDLREILSDITESNQAELASYVLHRKVILDLFEKRLGIQENSKYCKEDEIHKLIYPTKKDSEEVDFNQHNLWLIDERLSFHKYLASDKAFLGHKTIISESKDRPDICIYNDEENAPYQSVVIIEFKRPDRDNFNEHPIIQITRYVNEIKNSHIKDSKGRKIPVLDNTRFYAYVICDITKDFIKESQEIYKFTPTPDYLGMFNFNEASKVYCEIISFDKLLQDSKKRNLVLFDKLGVQL